MDNIKIENLTIEPSECLVEDQVLIGVTATNYGTEVGTRTIRCQYYKKEESMTVIFSGVVSAQAAVGEPVTITVTLPDLSTEQVTANTLEDKTFLVEYSNTPGDYTAKARIEADALYQAAESDEVPFVIGKEPRTITLAVA